MVDDISYLTKEKLNELTEELDYLKKTKRREVADSLEYAKSMGDLSENAEYQEARDMQAEVEERINKVENILKNAVVMQAHKGDTVEIGSTVVLKKSGEEAKTFQVVGSEEADISKGKISNNSIVGKAIMGKKKGDKFDINAPKGKVSYEIVEVK